MSYPDSTLCPEDTRESISLYVENGIPPGDFLQAFLANDLMEAVGRADYTNLGAFIHIAAYVYNNIPGGAHGSYEKVNAWIKAKRES